MAWRNWTEEMRPWTAAAGNIGQEMLQLPVLRARLAQQREQDAQAAELNAARVRNYEAETGYRQAETKKTDAETARHARMGAALERLGKNAPVMQRAFETGDFSSPEAQAGLGDVATVTGENKGNLVQMYRQLASVGLVGREGTNASPKTVRFAGALENPVSIANNEADNAGLMQRQLARAALPGAEYETTTTVYPRTEETTEKVMVNPGEKRSAFGFDFLAKDVPPTYKTVTTPVSPERRVTTRRRLGSGAALPAANGESGTDMDDEAQEETQDEMATPDQPAGITSSEPVTVPDEASKAALLKEANAAIAAGAPRDKVIARLKQQFGIIVR